MPIYHRILAGDVQPGDVVGRTRGSVARVATVRQGTTSVVFLDDSNRVIAKPRKTAKWWALREVN